MVSDEFFQTWGWRIPFIASVALIGISMFVQLKLEDTLAFRELEMVREAHKDEHPEARAVRRSPVLEALVKYPKTISLAAGAFLSIQVSFYILIAFILAYGSQGVAGMSRDEMLSAVLIASALMIPFQFWASGYSDRNGRRGIYMLGAILTGAWAFALFPMMYGPQAAFYTELFSTEVRYSGASLGYQFGAILGGAFAPMIATFLWTEYAIVWVSVYIALASVIALLCVWTLSETSGDSLHDVHGSDR